MNLQDKVALITDGRFSGGSHGFVVGHISPEAALGGPIALISEQCPSVFLVPSGEMFNKVVSSMQEIKARKGKIIAVITEKCELPAGLADEVILIPECHEAVLPIVATVTVQLLSYYIAVALHRDVDKPRNLAKSVTVE